ncbi:MAG TPA: hypothetical protein DDW30_05870 [Clostridiales bacterium]|nr:hypothetical protein [Clostridiales bacterium]
MKKTALTKAVTWVLVVVMLLATLASCAAINTGDSSKDTTGGKNDTTTEAPTTDTDEPDAPGVITVVVSGTKSEIKGDETVQMTAAVSNTDNTAVTWSTSDPCLKVTEDGVVSIDKTVSFTVDKLVTVTATSKADPTKSGKKTLIVRAETVEGRVGDLTSEMLEALGNASITVKGYVTDYYNDYNQPANNSEHHYETLVEMEDGRWKGTWYAEGHADTAVTTLYRRGTTTGLKDYYGNVGTAIEEMYIGKNNTAVAKQVKDYMSIPSLWETQHLWNHFANLNIEKFSYDVEHERYVYNVDLENEEDAYLMTYFAFCLTPMLDSGDTIANFYFDVQNGKITRMVAETIKETVTDNDGNVEQASYTMMTFTFSEVGSTTVSDPTPFEAPEHADLLKAAIEKMQTARNYTYRVVDVTTRSVSASDDDYTLESLNARSGKLSAMATGKYKNYTSTSGTVGSIGFVTADKIVIANTMKYTSSLDGKDYNTTYSGYKDNGNGTYDIFASNKDGNLYGTKVVKGNIFDKMPKFDFSENIFELSDETTKNGVKRYTFKLRETAITRDVTLEMSAYSYASSAYASIERDLRIVVDADGNIVSTVFPYNISDNYIGYCTTTYENFGTTKLYEDAFEGYVQREIKNLWNQYDVKYYHPNHSTLDGDVAAKASTVFEAIYGAEIAATLPTPELLMGIFGDNLNGPFFNWKEETAESGDVIYKDYLSITTTSDQYDENRKITNYDEIIAQLTEALKAIGFKVSAANTDTTGGETGRSNRYVTYTNDSGVQIVVENNFTSYFWIYFYKVGDWSLKK